LEQKNIKNWLKKSAFKKCSVIIVNNLDISAILPHLNSQELLTDNDYQFLLSRYITDVKKAQYLLDVLPRKEKFFDKFEYCLRQTRTGTGHGEIAKALSESYKEIKERNSQLDALMVSHTPIQASDHEEVTI